MSNETSKIEDAGHAKAQKLWRDIIIGKLANAGVSPLPQYLLDVIEQYNKLPYKYKQNRS